MHTCKVQRCRRQIERERIKEREGDKVERLLTLCRITDICERISTVQQGREGSQKQDWTKANLVFQGKIIFRQNYAGFLQPQQSRRGRTLQPIIFYSPPWEIVRRTWCNTVSQAVFCRAPLPEISCCSTCQAKILNENLKIQLQSCVNTACLPSVGYNNKLKRSTTEPNWFISCYFVLHLTASLVLAIATTIV